MRGSKLSRWGCDSVEWGDIVRPSRSYFGMHLRLYFWFLTPEGIVEVIPYAYDFVNFIYRAKPGWSASIV